MVSGVGFFRFTWLECFSFILSSYITVLIKKSLQSWSPGARLRGWLRWTLLETSWSHTSPNPTDRWNMRGSFPGIAHGAEHAWQLCPSQPQCHLHENRRCRLRPSWVHGLREGHHGNQSKHQAQQPSWVTPRAPQALCGCQGQTHGEDQEVHVAGRRIVL